MDLIESHIRFMERFMRNNPDATIKDYFEVTDGLLENTPYAKKRKTLLEDIDGTLDKIETALKHGNEGEKSNIRLPVIRSKMAKKAS